jgi:hypothetical protein
LFGGRGAETNAGRSASNSPLGTGLEFSSLIKLGSQIKVVDLRSLTVSGFSDDKRVDLEVSEVEINVDRVQTSNEVNQDITLVFRNVLEESLLDGLSRGEAVIDLDKKLHGLGVNITNFDTTFVGEKDVITLTFTVDTDIVFSVGRMGNEGFNQESLEETSSLLNL